MKICYMGDSISASVESGIRQPRSIGDYVSFQINNTESRNTTYPSDGLEEQEVRWDQISDSEKLTFDYIISQNGYNNSSTEIAALYQTFFDRVRTEIKSSCKIIQVTVTPYGGAVGLSERLAKNVNLLALTGIDAFVTEHMAYLDDGDNNLKSPYYATDKDRLHLSVAGRIVVADCVVQKMRELKWI